MAARDQGVIYCRVSTQEQVSNFSLERQEIECRKALKARGFSVARVFVDEGKSAKTTDRPAFQEMLEYCKKNKSVVRTAIALSIDRLARNAFDYLGVSRQLASLGIALTTVVYEVEETPEGQFSALVMAGQAQMENDRKGLRSLRGMQDAFKAGRWVWKAPRGYVNQGGFLKQDPIIGPLVRQAFQMRADGYTKTEIVKILKRKGMQGAKGRSISTQSVSAMLKNPIYMGEMRSSKWDVSEMLAPLGK